MTLTIELSPEQEARLTAAARREGVPPAQLASRLLADHLPLLADAETPNPTVALLESWITQDATQDETEIRQAQAELDRFKQDLNMERERAGARRAYP
ncbi:MAG TPA: hypothetical protein VFU47_09375 [Armatimonadota bacterium]|nr:hypothetical protein [Armatimonadota bacterium]